MHGAGDAAVLSEIRSGGGPGGTNSFLVRPERKCRDISGRKKMADSRLISSRSRFTGLLISNLMFTDAKLGRGSDATVYAVEWNGTVCAAKRIHEILLEDESPGGADKFISNCEVECLTWSKLVTPASSSSWACI